jgi:hypothetical protein
VILSGVGCTTTRAMALRAAGLPRVQLKQRDERNDDRRDGA